jgi:NADPH2:quinone reductase
VPLDSMDMLMRSYTAVGVLAAPGSPQAEAAAWGLLADLAGQGAITTPVGKVYDFQDVPQMIADQTAPPAGKSVVRVALA